MNASANTQKETEADSVHAGRNITQTVQNMIQP